MRLATEFGALVSERCLARSLARAIVSRSAGGSSNAAGSFLARNPRKRRHDHMHRSFGCFRQMYTGKRIVVADCLLPEQAVGRWPVDIGEMQVRFRTHGARPLSEAAVDHDDRSPNRNSRSSLTRACARPARSVSMPA